MRQPDRPGLPPDSAEAVEIVIEGEVVPGASTLSSCGVERLSPFNANGGDGACGPSAGYYGEVDIGSLKVPASRRLVVGNVKGAAAPLSQPASALQNGPDLLALRSASGAVVHAVTYPAQQGGPLALCAVVPSPESVPADGPGPGGRNLIVARCPGGGWAAVDEAQAPWGAEPSCDQAGGPGSGGQAGLAPGPSSVAPPGQPKHPSPAATEDFDPQPEGCSHAGRYPMEARRALAPALALALALISGLRARGRRR